MEKVSIWWFTPIWSEWSGLGQTEILSQKIHLPWITEAPRTWAILRCFSLVISRELDQRRSRWDWCPCGILVLNSVVLSTTHNTAAYISFLLRCLGFCPIFNQIIFLLLSFKEILDNSPLLYMSYEIHTPSLWLFIYLTICQRGIYF